MAGRHASVEPETKRHLLEQATLARPAKLSAVAVTATAMAVVPLGISAGQGQANASGSTKASEPSASDIRVQRAASSEITAGPAARQAPASIVKVKAKPSHDASETTSRSASDKVSLKAKVTGDTSAPKINGHSASTGVDAGSVPVSESDWVRPTSGSVSSEYGHRGSLAAAGGTLPFHNGIDFAGAMGTPIHAANDGVVLHVGYNDFDTHTGGIVVVLHRTPSGDFLTSYNHMSLSGILVKEGQSVKSGEVIARVGSEGRATGPHVHFSTRVVTDISSPLTSWDIVPPREFMAKMGF